MKILAIDYGQKKFGIAISDETLLVSSALPTVFCKDENDGLTKIINLIQEKSPDTILLGIPSGWQNIDSPQTKIVRDFKLALEKSSQIPIIEWDESYSSKFSAKNLSGKQKKNSDSYAAALILQEYLDYLRYEKNK
jgi:putative Holliday junction resolvase